MSGMFPVNMVPAHVEVDSLQTLGAQAGEFDNVVYVLDTDDALEQRTDSMLAYYKIDDSFSVVALELPKLLALIDSSLEKDASIAFAGWLPSDAFGDYDVKLLVDHLNFFGDEEHIATVVRTGLKEESQTAYKLLDNFKWKPEDLEKVMEWNRAEGADVAANARKWVEENSLAVDVWLKDIEL